jgi:hypothetical protein
VCFFIFYVVQSSITDLLALSVHRQLLVGIDLSNAVIQTFHRGRIVAHCKARPRPWVDSSRLVSYRLHGNPATATVHKVEFAGERRRSQLLQFSDWSGIFLTVALGYPVMSHIWYVVGYVSIR